MSNMLRTIRRNVERMNPERPTKPEKEWPEGHARHYAPAGVRKHRRRMRPYLGEGQRGLTRMDRQMKKIGHGARRSWQRRALQWVRRIGGRR